MAAASLGSLDIRRQRRWSFAACTFDEGSWTLTVNGQRVPLETKPLELLRELLIREGKVVSKDELLDLIWPDVTVVEASLPTAIYKLRAALRDDRRERCIIETVPSIGYRLAVPIEAQDLEASDGAASSSSRSRGERGRRWWWVGVLAGVAILAIAATVLLIQRPTAATAGPFSQRDAGNALRRLDVPAIERMLAAGWDPNTPFDNEGNGAINYLLNMCEWDRGHDQRRMLLMVRTLFDGGAQLNPRNVWGDTPYSIAKADRYCGPNHPVTQMLRMFCDSGPNPLREQCLATYEVARGARW